MADITDGFFGDEDAGEGVEVQVNEKDQADFFAAMFFMKGMEALKKAATKPLYEESKGCIKEFMTLRPFSGMLGEHGHA